MACITYTYFLQTGVIYFVHIAAGFTSPAGANLYCHGARPSGILYYTKQWTLNIVHYIPH